MIDGGIWKKPTGKKRCPARKYTLFYQDHHRCMRPADHSGEHGWEFFRVRSG